MITERPAFSYQHDKAIPAFNAGDIFTVMDAQCGLCARGASWIARHDKAEEFRIVPVQSEIGEALLRHYGLDPADPTSWLFVEQGQAYTSLEALTRVGARFGGAWRALKALSILPRSFQDAAYKLVARNRYKVFGKTDMCTLPDPAVQKRLYR